MIHNNRMSTLMAMSAIAGVDLASYIDSKIPTKINTQTIKQKQDLLDKAVEKRNRKLLKRIT